MALIALREAIQMWLGLDAPYEASRARLLMAGAHARERDHARATFELEVAARAFASMGATRDLEQVVRLLDGESDNRRHPLTARQRQIAGLVAEGRSNREIAATLFISERTAEYHVQQILNRLGLNSRAQIAAWFARETA
jgi:DNA-binding NarL/FixJ family response regulator